MSEQGRIKRRARLLTVVRPQLKPGEQVELISFGMVGRTAKRQLVVLVALAAVASALGGVLIPILRPKYYYIVLTDQRLLVIANERRTGGFGMITMAVPREALTPTDLTDRVSLKACLHVKGSDVPLRLKYTNRSAHKEDGRTLIAALGGVNDPAATRT